MERRRIFFIAKTDFWGQQDFWAPDVYEYEGRYYLFATFSNAGVKRGTSILVSDSPKGPFTPLVNKAITPSGWMCLDGSLYIDKEGNPGCCSVVSGWRPSTVKFMPNGWRKI